MTEQLKAEIEEFKKECLQLWFCQSLADSYTNTSLFDHVIDKEGRVFWMKEQARQLWAFWQAATAQAVPEGFVVVPVEPSNAMLVAARDWSVKKYGQGVGNDGASGCYKAMIAAAQEVE